MKESEIESFLRRQVEERGGRCVKFQPDYARGWPDRLVLLPNGVSCWVELKRESGVISPAQLVAHEELRRLKQRVEVVWSKAEVDSLVRRLAGAHGREPKG